MFPIYRLRVASFEKALRDKVQRFPVAFDQIIGEVVHDAQTDLQNATANSLNPIESSVVKLRAGVWQLRTMKTLFNLLDKGAPRHDINAKTDKGMIFGWAASGKRGEYRAKTREALTPGSGDGGYESGTAVTGSMHVDHPGFKPRNWRKLIYRRQVRRLRARVKEALRKI